MDEQIISLIRENAFAAGLFGAVVGLYAVGRLEESGVIPDPLAVDDSELDVDAQIVFHEKKLEHLREIKESKKSVDDLYQDMAQMIAELKQEIQDLKGQQNA